MCPLAYAQNIVNYIDQETFRQIETDIESTKILIIRPAAKPVKKMLVQRMQEGFTRKVAPAKPIESAPAVSTEIENSGLPVTEEELTTKIEDAVTSEIGKEPEEQIKDVEPANINTTITTDIQSSDHDLPSVEKAEKTGPFPQLPEKEEVPSPQLIVKDEQTTGSIPNPPNATVRAAQVSVPERAVNKTQQKITKKLPAPMTEAPSPSQAPKKIKNIPNPTTKPEPPGCERRAFEVNDFGKEGPIAYAEQDLANYVEKLKKKKGVNKITVEKTDPTCRLFLWLGPWSEYTCRIEASMCW